MSQKRREYMALWFALAALLGAAAQFLLSDWIENPVPYRNVQVQSLTHADDQVFLVANFEKTHGVFERLVAIAGVAGETEFLYWYNLDPEVGDRTLGDQTLRIAISVLGIDYDWIEVRTRHDHNGDKIDKVFARFTPDDVKEATE
jgi:hypothetical protein